MIRFLGQKRNNRRPQSLQIGVDLNYLVGALLQLIKIVAEQSAFITGFVADTSHCSRSLYLIGFIRNCPSVLSQSSLPNPISEKICPPVANSAATPGIPI